MQLKIFKFLKSEIQILKYKWKIKYISKMLQKYFEKFIKGRNFTKFKEFKESDK